MDMSAVPTSSSNRILYDVPCAVCHDHSSGKHYGVFACDGCAGFFKRSVRRDRDYTCKSMTPGRCVIDKAHRNQCRACRLDKCLDAGMNKDSVQHERGPRNSTIQRQMEMLLREPSSQNEPIRPIPMALDLAMPKPSPLPMPSASYASSTFSFNRFKLPNSIVPFVVRSPPIMHSSYVNQMEPQAVCEAAARLLFMNVKWVKSVPSFMSLSFHDRLLLLEESWKELFVLGVAQFLYPISLRRLLHAQNSRLELKDVEIFDTVLYEFTTMRPDTNEYACMRGLVLFKTTFIPEFTVEHPDKPPKMKRLQDIATIATLQEQSRLVLSQYTSQAYPLDITRASRVCQLLDIIRVIPGNVIEDIFFRATIGPISIERIIKDMYSSHKELV